MTARISAREAFRIDFGFRPAPGRLPTCTGRRSRVSPTAMLKTSGQRLRHMPCRGSADHRPRRRISSAGVNSRCSSSVPARHRSERICTNGHSRFHGCSRRYGSRWLDRVVAQFRYASYDGETAPRRTCGYARRQDVAGVDASGIEHADGPRSGAGRVANPPKEPQGRRDTRAVTMRTEFVGLRRRGL